VSEAFKYDVAISLRARDADLAERLKAALHPLEVFVFTQRQQELAGKNLVETFTETFKRDARLAVILYRQGWGDTEYTDLEALAIQSRGLKTRWRSPVLIALDETPVPLWFPDVYGYLELARYGFEEAVGVIRARAEELGSLTRPESPTERTARRMQERAAAEARALKMATFAGVDEAKAELQRLFSLIEEHADQVKAHGADLAVRTKALVPPASQGIEFGLRTSHASTNIHWATSVSNRLSGGQVTVIRAREVWRLPGEGYATGNGRATQTVTFYKMVLAADGWRWQEVSRAQMGDLDVPTLDPDTPSPLTDDLAHQLVEAHLDLEFSRPSEPEW
jgi:hypothetical protein